MEDIDVWRAAQLLIRQHGKAASGRADMRAQELQAEGATEGADVWRRIVAAIAELEREPSASEPRN